MRNKIEDRKVRRMRQDEEHYEESPCAHKKSYRSQLQAEQSLGRVLSHKDEWRSDKFPCRVYFCDLGPAPCFMWHLTSTELQAHYPHFTSQECS